MDYGGAYKKVTNSSYHFKFDGLLVLMGFSIWCYTSTNYANVLLEIIFFLHFHYSVYCALCVTHCFIFFFIINIIVPSTLS